ncbi:MAG: type II toxin-antitoxin system RelE/ParE family toxin [Coriobacteriales bacterium]|jgi:plasmid stabilization system protein ParE|nr:type II toxin-antitoxin system RelE/ParE family toxin [Coriobacteriales bacterium]
MAHARMLEHFEFLARVNEAAATKLLDTLTRDIRSLAKMPQRNPLYDKPNISSGEYRWMLSAKRYRIVYEIADDTVFIEDIQDCSESDEKRLL